MRVGADSRTQTGTCRGEMDCKTIGINAPVPLGTETEREEESENATLLCLQSPACKP